MPATMNKSNRSSVEVTSDSGSLSNQDLSTYAAEQKKDNTVELAADGDLVLRIEHSNGLAKATPFSFRVSSAVLKSTSRYFDRLLQPGRFGEAAEVEAKHQAIRAKYEHMAAVPLSDLPIVNVEDVGRIPIIRAVIALLTDFLSILHGNSISNSPPVANLANLAIVADRFDAIDTVKDYVKRHDLIKMLDRKTTSRLDVALDEEKVRQRLLVAILLDYPPWLDKYSARVITKGWVGNEPSPNSALWYDLPSRVEDELTYRLDCILETIQSVQQYFLALYSSRERQCKLGYDNSGQCDSFQLGEIVRFFTRVGTLHFQDAISGTDSPPAPYRGDLHHLLHSLKQVPEYQIDRFHTHCGIRTRIMPLLELLQEGLRSVGICPECWQADRMQYAWVEAKRPSLWERQRFRLNAQGHADVHYQVRMMFMAVKRDWS